MQKGEEAFREKRFKQNINISKTFVQSVVLPYYVMTYVIMSRLWTRYIQSTF